MTELAVSHQQLEIPNLHLYRLPISQQNILEEIVGGLAQEEKRLSPRFLYDTRGSWLFDAITRLPEYYPTRTEQQIFSLHSREIRSALPPQSVIIEPGSGNGEKARLLISSVDMQAYVPVEICESHLLKASERIVKDFPGLEVHAVCADFTQIHNLPDEIPAEPRTVFFPGSTIGNFEPAAAIDLLQAFRRWVGQGGNALIGVDCKKEQRVLEAAYNDQQGVTSEFNRNILSNINKLTGADFMPEQFEHQAFYNERSGRIEMHLRSVCRQKVSIGSQVVEFAEGESIHTESSYKYEVQEFAQLAMQAGFEHQHCWQDPRGYFGLHYLRA
jgi:L-histidine N-alpha-methyltransferase